MDIGRRELLVGSASLGLAILANPVGLSRAEAEYPSKADPGWHPLTQSLLDRASRAGQQTDRSRVERIVHALAGEHGRPIIKWMDTPSRAFEHLLRYPLDELAQMPTAQLWPFGPPVSAASEDEEDHSIELYLHATQVLRVEEHGRTLLAPKLSYKERAITSLSFHDQILEARAVAAEIGWIETSLPGAAAGAIRAVEDLLSAGYAESSMEICHQLMVFEAFEHGLLATWETPGALVCISKICVS